MARIEHINGDLTQDPNVAVDILHAGPATDAEETASWVQNLLRRIHREVGEKSLQLSLPIVEPLFS